MKYYYLICSLKDLYFDTERLPHTIEEFISHIAVQQPINDFGPIKAFLHRYDNENVINLLEKREDYNPLGTFTRDALQEEFNDPKNLPEYLIIFLNKIREEKRDSNLSPRDELEVFYYKYLVSYPNLFLRSYTGFDYNLRNILVALNCRKHHLDLEQYVLPINKEATLLTTSKTHDFNLAKHLDWFNTVYNLFEKGNSLEMEKRIDLMRYNFIESELTFKYFTVSNLLGYLIQLLIVKRWIALDPEEGKLFFDRFTGSLSDKAIDIMNNLLEEDL